MFRKLTQFFLISLIFFFNSYAQTSYDNVIKAFEPYSAFKISGWEIGNNSANNKNFDDNSKWKPFSGEYSTDDSCKWFRAKIKTPDKIAETAVRNEKTILDIEADGLCEVFIDGHFLTEFKNPKGSKRCVLFEKAEPSTEHILNIKLKQSTIISRFFGATLELEKVSPLLKKIGEFKLSIETANTMTTSVKEFIKEKKFSINQSQTSEIRLKDLKAVLDKACSQINISALSKSEYKEFNESIDAAYKTMEPISKFAKEYTIYISGNAHIDAAWLWRSKETIEVVRYTFLQQLKLMEEYPEFIYSQGSAVYYQWMEKLFPEIFNKIKDKIKTGNWDLVGGLILEPDCNLISGESWARQLLYGKSYFYNTFGESIPLGWNPDSFGYNWNIPQLYSLAGIKAFITQKISWNDTNEFPYHLFWWQGVDGSKILTYFPMSGYVNTLDRDGLLNDLKQSEANTGRKDVLVLYGFGDHGGGPERFMLENVLKLKDNPFFPNVTFTKAYDYLKNMSTDYLSSIPVWKDELYLEYHRGTYTTQAAIKSGNRRSEFGLASAEKFSTLSMLYGNEYPKKSFYEAWQKTLFNQFHDILPGSSIAPVYKDAKEDYDIVKTVFKNEQNKSMDYIASMVNTNETKGIPFVIFNQSSWNRTDICSIVIPEKLINKNIVVYDETGKIIPSQLSGEKIYFTAANVPSLGYVTYSISESTTDYKINTELKAAGQTAENRFFKLKVNNKTGNISSIFDKINNKEVLASEGNKLQLFEDRPTQYDAWEIKYTGVKWDLNEASEVTISEAGPVLTKIKVKKSFLGESKERNEPTSTFPSSFFTQDIILYNDIPRIDVDLEADWWEVHILAKMALPVNVTNNEATYEIPNSAIKRPTTRNNSWEKARYEVPALTWADLSDGNYGVSLLNIDKYGHDIEGNVMRLTLLRSPTYPDPFADRGKHKTTYSIYPHKGSWETAGTPQRAFELNNPLFTTFTGVHAGKLPKSFSFIGIDNKNVIISAVKKAEEDNSIIIRMYESTGKSADATLTLPLNVKAINESDLLETKIGKLETVNNSVILKFRPFETKTIRVEY
jgi:alpha-mannosidase